MGLTRTLPRRETPGGAEATSVADALVWSTFWEDGRIVEQGWMATQELLPGAEDRAVWVTCPSCMGIWCRTHDMHIDQCVCPVSPVKRRVSWLDPVGTDKTPKELAREFIHWRCDRMDQGLVEFRER
jgi:hypothetical protein